MEAEQPETSAALWKAIWELADAWSETPAVQETSALLPRNRPTTDIAVGAAGIPAALHHLDISAGGFMHPLLYGSRVPAFIDDPMVNGFGMPPFDRAELAAWLENAGRVEHAHRVTLGWLRSSLAGYPVLRAPQLAPGSPMTSDDVTARFNWPRQEFASGLNQQATPLAVPDLLGASPSSRDALGEAARRLGAQFRASRPWSVFGDASRALDERAKAQLRQARLDLKARVADDRVDEHEERRALPRAEYRVHATADIINSLTGPARAYADAFAEIHRFLTLTACDVFGELVLYGEPWPIQASGIDVPDPGQPIIEFESPAPAAMFFKTGQIVRLDSKLVTDAVRLEGVSMNMGLADGTRDQFRARVLKGTAEAWPTATATGESPRGRAPSAGRSRSAAR